MTGRLANNKANSRHEENSWQHWHRTRDSKRATGYWFPNLQCRVVIEWDTSNFVVNQPKKLGGKFVVPLGMYDGFRNGDLTNEPGGMADFIVWCRCHPEELE